jgi:hypothetical protein
MAKYAGSTAVFGSFTIRYIYQISCRVRSGFVCMTGFNELDSAGHCDSLFLLVHVGKPG